MHVILQVSRGRNWLSFWLRWILLVGFTAAILIAHQRNFQIFPQSLLPVSDLLLALGIGIAATVVLGIFGSVKTLQPYAEFVQLPGDWLITAAFVYVSANTLIPAVIVMPTVIAIPTTMMLVTGITTTMIISGALRLRSAEAFVQGLGVMVSAALVLANHPLIGIREMRQNPFIYGASVLFPLVALLVSAGWAYFLSGDNNVVWKRVRKENQELSSRLAKMQESALSFSEMAASLNSSLNYDNVIQTALSIGRLSLRVDPKQRVVAVVLMVDGDRLEISASQGLTHADMQRKFRGSTQSIIGRVIEKGEVEIMGHAEDDPELEELISFRGIESLLCVPLRSDFTSYGVVLYGSSAPKAFSADNIEMLKSLGVQVTIALKNAVLYASLMDEKRRLIEIEEAGRKALVRDLHDVPTQTMSWVAMQLSVLPIIASRTPEKLKEETEAIRERALRAVEEIRYVMFSLRPLSLETQGLGEALNQLAEKMIKTYKQDMHIDCDPNAEALLDKDQRGTLFYLIEEASNNARKHAEASLIRISVKHEAKYVVVRIIDNGKGFDKETESHKAQKRGSFGMVNMKDRASIINGTYDLQSAAGRGTTITVSIPVGIEAPEPGTNPKRPNNGKGRPNRERMGPMSPTK
jgi:signal transduction histidine kinase